MINTLAPRAFTSPTRVFQAPAKTEAPQPAVCPRPMPDSIDLSSIDTPQKAAQLPILDPSFQLGLAGGIAATIMAAMGGGTAPQMQLNYQSQTGANQTNLTYSADINAQQTGASPLTVSGTHNGQAVSGGLVIDDAAQALTWKAQFGTSQEAYSFGPGGTQQAPELVLKGMLGSVEANLNFSVLGDVQNPNPDTIQGYKVSGTLGGESYESTTLFNLNPEVATMQQPPAQGQNVNIGSITTTGHLGQLPIDKQYTVEAQMSDTSIVAVASGGGLNAGVNTQSTTTLTVSQ
ncbi:hypothetical protein IV102_32280 [bacterium]|nr:hypothetical protein [bacterium]